VAAAAAFVAATAVDLALASAVLTAFAAFSLSIAFAAFSLSIALRDFRVVVSDENECTSGKTEGAASGSGTASCSGNSTGACSISKNDRVSSAPMPSYMTLLSSPSRDIFSLPQGLSLSLYSQEL
jgi:hypothetical protein